MSLLIDIIVIAAFALCFCSGIKKGFTRSVMGIAVVAIAIIGSINISPKFAPYINEKFVREPVISIAEDSVSKLLSDSVDVDTLIDEQPQAFLSVLKRFGVEADDIKNLFNSSENEETDDEKVKRIAEHIGSPIAAALSKAVSFIIVFIVLLIVLFIAAFILTLVVKLPVLKVADKLMGGVLGAVMGILLCWGLSLAICALMPHLAVLYEGTVPESVIENSIVVKYLGGIDSLKLFGN